MSNRPCCEQWFICKKYTVKHTCIHSWLPRCSFSLERQFIDVHFTSILLFRSPHLFSLQSLRNVAVGRPAHPCDTVRRWTGDSCSRVSQPPSTFTGSTDHRVHLSVADFNFEGTSYVCYSCVAVRTFGSITAEWLVDDEALHQHLVRRLFPRCCSSSPQKPQEKSKGTSAPRATDTPYVLTIWLKSLSLSLSLSELSTVAQVKSRWVS